MPLAAPTLKCASASLGWLRSLASASSMALSMLVRNIAALSAGGAFTAALDSGSELRNSSAVTAPRVKRRSSHAAAAMARQAAESPGRLPPRGGTSASASSWSRLYASSKPARRNSTDRGFEAATSGMSAASSANAASAAKPVSRRRATPVLRTAPIPSAYNCRSTRLKRGAVPKPRAIRRYRTLDAHAAGEPLRLIIDGYPAPKGRTMLEKRAWVKRHADAMRRALMLEPRGHADMYGARPDRARDGRSRRRRALHAQRGLQHDVRPRHRRRDDDRARARADPSAGSRTAIVYDSPAGPCAPARMSATRRARGRAGVRVDRVAFDNVPSFVLAPGLPVRVGAPRDPRGCRVRRRVLRDCRRRGGRAADCARRDCPNCGAWAWRSSTPSRPPSRSSIRWTSGLNGIYGTIFTGPPERERRGPQERDRSSRTPRWTARRAAPGPAP